MSVLSIARTIDIAVDCSAVDVDVGAIEGIIAASDGTCHVVATIHGLDEDVLVAFWVIRTDIDLRLTADIAHESASEDAVSRTRDEVDCCAGQIVAVLVARSVDIAVEIHVHQSDITNEAASIDIPYERTSLDRHIRATLDIAQESASEDVHEVEIWLGCNVFCIVGIGEDRRVEVKVTIDIDEHIGIAHHVGHLAETSAT